MNNKNSAATGKHFLKINHFNIFKFLTLTRGPLATPRGPPGVREPQVKRHWAIIFIFML